MIIIKKNPLRKTHFYGPFGGVLRRPLNGSRVFYGGPFSHFMQIDGDVSNFQCRLYNFFKSGIGVFVSDYMGNWGRRFFGLFRK